MVAGTVPLRENAQEITLFKSIGMSYSDLIAAGLVYDALDK
jgi:ornithine cyclodeaminase/alanine dehydrogenase-like protein (mu-crystallin family)